MFFNLAAKKHSWLPTLKDIYFAQDKSAYDEEYIRLGSKAGGGGRHLSQEGRARGPGV